MTSIEDARFAAHPGGGLAVRREGWWETYSHVLSDKDMKRDGWIPVVEYGIATSGQIEAWFLVANHPVFADLLNAEELDEDSLIESILRRLDDLSSPVVEITEEMVERGAEVLGSRETDALIVYSILEKALNGPTRSSEANEIYRDLGEVVTPLIDGDRAVLADHLASLGYRKEKS